MDNATAIVLANAIEDLTTQVRSHEDTMRAVTAAYLQVHEDVQRMLAMLDPDAAMQVEAEHARPRRGR